MKTLLILEDKDLSTNLITALKNLGMSVIHYRDPIKALDNLPELDPDAVIISTIDYPRHWKPIAAAIRAVKSRNSCIIILLKGQYFSYDEAAKAAILEVNGVVEADIKQEDEIGKIIALFNRYFSFTPAQQPISPAVIDFVFTHPDTGNLIIGNILDIANNSLTFQPDFPPLTETLTAGTKLENAFLQVQGNTFSVTSSIQKTGLPLIISLDDLTKDARDLLENAMAIV